MHSLAFGFHSNAIYTTNIYEDCFSARPVDEQDDQEDSYGSDFSSDETDQEIDSDVDVDFADCDISPGGGEYSLI